MYTFPNTARVSIGDAIPSGFPRAVSGEYTPPEEAARARGGWYGLFAGICHAAPPPQLIEAFVTGDLAQRTCDLVGDEVAADWVAFAAAPDVDRARLDYAALLKVPGGRYATANESVWADAIDVEGAPRTKGLLMGPSTVDMKARWRAIGLEPNGAIGELPDYLGLELHYLECLCELEAEAWLAGDAARARFLLDQQRAFHDDHLGRWVRQVGQKIIDGARGPFFRGYGQIVPVFVAQDRELLGALLAAG